ncbi:hypothetical protein KC866_01155 [Patescibacteria group bacterium]|nr:hypothetical protein [Patescibacteria group bacterium]
MKNFLTRVVSGFVTLALISMYAPVAFAAAATDLSDNMDRQKISEAATHVIGFTLPTALAASGTIDVTFPGSFTGTAATSSTDWSAPSSNVVRYTDSGSGQSAGTAYSVTVTGMVNPSSAANYSISISGSNGDTGSITVPILDDDQILVTATVDQALTFDVRDSDDDDNAVGFGSLSSGSITYANTGGTGSGSEVANGSSQFLASTNATGGYTVNVEGETLTSGSDTITAMTSAAAPTAGQEEFGLSVDVVSGTGTVSTNYAGTNYYLNPGVADTVVTQTGPVSTETYGVNYVANIDGSTEAGTYTTTLTYTMTANF